MCTVDEILNILARAAYRENTWWYLISVTFGCIYVENVYTKECTDWGE